MKPDTFLPGYPKIMLDMDGVLTNFEKAVKAIGRKAARGLSDKASDEDKKFMYDSIDNAGVEFWSQMEWLEDGKKLWKFLKPYKPILLSSPGQLLYAEDGKTQWVKANIPGTTLLLEPDKYRYAERDAILIDDMLDNVTAWEEQGGTGILFEDADTTIAKLKEILPKRIKTAEALRVIARVFYQPLLS